MDIVTKDMKYYKYFKNTLVYDESCPIYVFTVKHKFDLFKNIQTTYVSLQDGTQEANGNKHPNPYDKIDDNLLVKLSDRDILFARKFTCSLKPHPLNYPDLV